jgi:hypothetical protein
VRRDVLAGREDLSNCVKFPLPGGRCRKACHCLLFAKSAWPSSAFSWSPRCPPAVLVVGFRALAGALNPARAGVASVIAAELVATRNTVAHLVNGLPNSSACTRPAPSHAQNAVASSITTAAGTQSVRATCRRGPDSIQFPRRQCLRMVSSRSIDLGGCQPQGTPRVARLG